MKKTGPGMGRWGLWGGLRGGRVEGVGCLICCRINQPMASSRTMKKFMFAKKTDLSEKL